MSKNLYEPPGCACFNLKKASRAVTRYFDRQLEPLDLTTPQFTVLAVLHELQPVPLTKLAEALVLERTTLTRNLKRLKKKELVMDEPGEKDARQRLISLTKAGEDRYQSAYPVWKDAQEEVMGRLGEKDFKELIDLLQLIPDRLS